MPKKIKIEFEKKHHGILLKPVSDAHCLKIEQYMKFHGVAWDGQFYAEHEAYKVMGLYLSKREREHVKKGYRVTKLIPVDSFLHEIGWDAVHSLTL